MTQAAEISSDWSALDQKLQTFVKLMTTKAAIGQTPKEIIWTLNKAKLYRYIPVVPPKETASRTLASHICPHESSHDSRSSPRP